ncbi:hypothetical protein [Sinorhizobium mexicanum]|uniref:Uncharacterized protein n=1 Tax=Sinorhizobium mexicanum TaxID=375549 RepID=A0A859QIK8_9HYPH|nr:hypothetical protein [Sinorhizobium mexicanum]MBP1884886.1 hypothetical protein [Sinorhizobium mexicanum]QLL64534.1 hypothetical protein FKV68_24315 [Sinorhizobium mexicanum]
MREELAGIISAIKDVQLPATFDGLFRSIWSQDEARFHSQEGYILDYKETVPHNFTESYGVGFVRLALGFYNSFGGIIVVGVKDRALTVEGVAGPFDVESFNRALTDFAAINIECLSKVYRVPGLSDKQVAVILVPKRGGELPARLQREVGKYRAGTLWVRDRHEVLQAEPRHLALLYSERQLLPADSDEASRFPVHRSFPPSPATMKEFINRGDLLSTLWNWFVAGENPRLYLHGPGGSGKSTLAFEFARILAEHGHGVRSRSGDRLDYVIFISGKETELNPLSGKEQSFALRQFSNAREEFVQIIHHSGMMSLRDASDASDGEISRTLDELFSEFSGLIVLDDIDALSRRGLETGEESLFIKSVLAKKRTRILYTLRYPPQHALTSSLSVPGLDAESEFFAFLEVCCKQFDVPHPQPEIVHQIATETNLLPLLIETVVGLRRFCGNYTQALELFRDKGGNESRRYLYQREYDRLDRSGKSRHVLGALYLVEEPVSFTTLSSLFQFTTEQIRDALSECASVFLSTAEDEQGETVYQLTPPCIPFIRLVSQQLPHFEMMKAKVKYFNGQGSKYTPEVAAVISSLQVMIREKRFVDMVSLGESFSPNDTVLANPKVLALLGQACAELGPDHKEKARAYFRQAEGIGYHDVFMMRRWYNMEANYNLPEAERICTKMIENSRDNPRALSEFWSKQGQCFFTRANSLATSSRDKALTSLRDSVVSYFEGNWIAASAKFDASDACYWAERPLHRLVSLMGEDIEHIFLLIEQLAQRRHDITADAAQVLIRYVRQIPAPIVEGARRKIKGLCSRTSQALVKSLKDLQRFPGFAGIYDELSAIHDLL